MSAYFTVTEGETNTRKYANKLTEKWAEMYPDMPFTGKHLIAQIRNIKNRKLLSPDEITSMKTEALLRSSSSRLRNIRRSILEMTSHPRCELNVDTERETPLELETVPNESIREIKAVYDEISMKWSGIPIENRPRISRIIVDAEAKNTMKAINLTLESEITESEEFNQVCHKLYCAAMTANMILLKKTKEKINIRRPQKPPWEERLEKKITALRQEIGIIQHTLNSQKISRKVQKKLRLYTRRIRLKETDSQYKMKLRIHSEELKQKIAAKGRSDINKITCL
ncbi:uncharacterized protein LOC123313979 [Coccinella septempunctata]|uniref:uncharacterized protein LOC123313979 n=1 Tax=Coccinella septempunctata TaxID=41139 RepID=UPI001D05FC68|nr:uncharacterized protein LOC123313979 [Coccinella septempunctata]